MFNPNLPESPSSPFALLLGLLIFSFSFTSVLLVPFINLLYKFRFTRASQKTKDMFDKPTPIFDKFHNHKQGTPVGGGFLIILVVSLLFTFLFPLVKFLGLDITHVYPIKEEINVIFFTFISFGILGLYDDIMKFFNFKNTGFFGLRMRYKFLIQWILAFVIASMLYFNLKIDIFYLPFFGVFDLGILFVPVAAIVIVSFTNAVNVTDGLDGLSSGLMMIALFAFWFLSAAILDTPLSFFLALWLGSIIAFLYFNVYPARIWLGDVGSLAFGATFAVVGLLLGKVMALMIIGGIFVLEITSSLLQVLSKKFRGKKLFKVSPFHLFLQDYGWEEPKIVQRAWLAAIMLAIFGIWLAIV
ncbi:phospho-N-acetylmuramoyl-pentapeptide-transferase [Candidatus Beckwithbacteria bacterium]|nr:phospho-N-acetylmuramoyl-pentapeptide-transferase [Candidatus Beckwithbacteria bacterium]